MYFEYKHLFCVVLMASFEEMIGDCQC